MTDQSATPSLVDRATILEKVRGFVADAADCSIDTVTPDVDLYATLHLDSLGATAVFIDISYAFEIPEPPADTDYAALNTPAALVRYVEERRLGLGTAAADDPLAAAPARAIEPAAPDTAALLARLPYGDALRCVDAIDALHHDQIVTRKEWRTDDPRIAAHLRGGRSVVPGIYLAEQAAQSALLIGLSAPPPLGGGPFVLSNLVCDFRRPASAPCTVVARVWVNAASGGEIGFMATCHVDRHLVARITGSARALGRELEP